LALVASQAAIAACWAVTASRHAGRAAVARVTCRIIARDTRQATSTVASDDNIVICDRHEDISLGIECGAGNIPGWKLGWQTTTATCHGSNRVRLPEGEAAQH